MSVTDQRPDPRLVSHEAVATIARERAAELLGDVILRDAKIRELTEYIDALERENAELRGKITAADTRPRPAAPGKQPVPPVRSSSPASPSPGSPRPTPTSMG